MFFHLNSLLTVYSYTSFHLIYFIFLITFSRSSDYSKQRSIECSVVNFIFSSIRSICILHKLSLIRHVFLTCERGPISLLERQLIWERIVYLYSLIRISSANTLYNNNCCLIFLVPLNYNYSLSKPPSPEFSEPRIL